MADGAGPGVCGLGLGQGSIAPGGSGRRPCKSCQPQWRSEPSSPPWERRCCRPGHQPRWWQPRPQQRRAGCKKTRAATLAERPAHRDRIIFLHISDTRHARNLPPVLLAAGSWSGRLSPFGAHGFKRSNSRARLPPPMNRVQTGSRHSHGRPHLRENGNRVFDDLRSARRTPRRLFYGRKIPKITQMNQNWSSIGHGVPCAVRLNAGQEVAAGEATDKRTRCYQMGTNPRDIPFENNHIIHSNARKQTLGSSQHQHTLPGRPGKTSKPSATTRHSGERLCSLHSEELIKRMQLHGAQEKWPERQDWQHGVIDT